METAATAQEESPIIRIPSDRSRVQRLGTSLGDYAAALHIGNYDPPEGQMALICLVEIVSSLLKEGAVKVWDICNGLAGKYGDGLNGQLDAFSWACRRVDQYCTGESNRLPAVKDVPTH